MTYCAPEDVSDPCSIEEWLAIRNSHNRSDLSDWEQDMDFLEFALREWPQHMGAVSRGGYHSQTARTNLRLRHQGYAGRRRDLKRQQREH